MRIWRNWQTRMVQVHMNASSCRFKSCYPHQVSRSRNLELINETTKIRLLFYAENRAFELTFRCYPLLQKWDIQKEKSKNRNVKMEMDQIRTWNSQYNEDSFFLSQYSCSFCSGVLYCIVECGRSLL